MISLLKTKGGYIIAFLLVFLLISNFSAGAQEMGEELYLDEPLERIEEMEVIDEWENWEDDAEEDDWLYEEMGGDDVWIQDDWMVDDDWLDAIYGANGTEMTSTEAAATFAIVMGIWLLFMAPLYIYFALTLMVTAKKLGLKNGWFAWVPILNMILLFQCAGLSPWLFLFLLIPLMLFYLSLFSLANILAIVILMISIIAAVILTVYSYMKIAERRGFESWLGILIILPIANLIIPGYLAWGEPPKKEA